jgi:type IV fimbrial biogenesis protein FimT
MDGLVDLRHSLDRQERPGMLRTAFLQHHRRGFTLIEMMVVVTIMALLAVLAMPSMLGWVRNNKIRTVSDSLQNGLRQAQVEATRRSRQMVFSVTDDKPTPSSTSYTAKASGSNWALSTVVPADSDATAAFVEAGILLDVGSDVVISGPVAVCFSSIGRLVPNDTPGPTNAKCKAEAAQYDIAMNNSKTGDRALRVTVALGGQVRMCDPQRTLSATQPDGCP